MESQYRIPTNRPVVGQDLDRLRRRLVIHHGRDISCEEMSAILRIQRARWTSITGRDPKTKQNNSKRMVNDLAIALLVRLYDERPDLARVEKMISARQLHNMIGDSHEYFAGMLGKKAPSGYRWLEKNGEMSPVVERLGKDIYNLLVEDAEKGTEENRQWWLEIRNDEAELRANPDIVGGRRRPVIGQNLDDLRRKLVVHYDRDISCEEMSSILRIQRARWTSITGRDPKTKQNNKKRIVNDFSIALLVRLYDARPDLADVEMMMTSAEMFSIIKGTYEYFAGMLGKKSPSGYRWIEKHGAMAPVVERLGKDICNLLIEDKKNGNDKNRSWWEGLYNDEVERRGEDRKLVRPASLEL